MVARHATAAVWCVVAALAAGCGADSRELFNGRDLEGWVVEGPREYTEDGQSRPLWSVRDGLLVCEGRAYGFLRYERQEFADFTLHVEYRMAARANSGIGIRTVPYDHARTDTTRPSAAAFEVQLMDDADQPQPTVQSSGALYNLVAPTVSGAVRPSPEWNAVDVECGGPHVRVTINGRRVLDADQRAAAATKDRPRKGYVSLQSHTNRVEVRSVRIQEK